MHIKIVTIHQNIRKKKNLETINLIYQLLSHTHQLVLSKNNQQSVKKKYKQLIQKIKLLLNLSTKKMILKKLYYKMNINQLKNSSMKKENQFYNQHLATKMIILHLHRIKNQIAQLKN